MDKQYLHEKLDAMRQNFVESTHHERAVGVLDQAQMMLLVWWLFR